MVLSSCGLSCCKSGFGARSRRYILSGSGGRGRRRRRGYCVISGRFRGVIWICIVVIRRLNRNCGRCGSFLYFGVFGLSFLRFEVSGASW